MENENNKVTDSIEQDTRQGENRTFTQDDVNRIVQDRLAKERGKKSEELAAREADLCQREFKLDAAEVLKSKGLPVEFLDALNCKDKEAFNKSVEIIGDYIKQIKTEEEVKSNRVKFSAPISSHKGVKDGIRAAMGLN